MHTDFAFSADVIAEETREFMHRSNFTMDWGKPWSSRHWMLKICVQRVIVKHVENDLKSISEDGEDELQPPTGALTFELFDTNLGGYTEDQITLDNIVPCVHALFKGNWGIDVTVAQHPHDLDRWYISNVEFVEDDPIK